MENWNWNWTNFFWEIGIGMTFMLGGKCASFWGGTLIAFVGFVLLDIYINKRKNEK